MKTTTDIFTNGKEEEKKEWSPNRAQRRLYMKNLKKQQKNEIKKARKDRK